MRNDAGAIYRSKMDRQVPQSPACPFFHFMKKNNLEGEKVGRLTVIREAVGEEKTQKRIQWLCKCDCGNTTVVSAGRLTIGLTLSCGCLHIETFNNKKHGGSDKSNQFHFEYGVYRGMKRRCYSPKNDDYKNYGGRGIKVCDRWLGESGFLNFMLDMGPRPSSKHSLDRIENDGNYGPGNCRWATKKEQAANTRRNVWIEYMGQRKIMSDWKKLLKVSYMTVQIGRYQGKSYKDIFDAAIKRNGIDIKIA